MQYGVEVFPYQRVKSINEKKKQKVANLKSIIKLFILLITGFLISRVIFKNYSAPFGVAFILAIIFEEDRRKVFASIFGTFLGYISLSNNVNYIGAYFLVIGTVLIIHYILREIEKKKVLILLFCAIFIELAFYRVLILQSPVSVSFIYSLLEAACIYPLYYIMDYSIKCFKNYNTNHLYSSNEIISMEITLSLVISGLWGVQVSGISIRNAAAICFILIISYIKGSSSGAACGTALGLLIGISTNNLIVYAGLFGLIGLVFGALRETGKWISGSAFLLVFTIIKIYSGAYIPLSIMEVFLGGVLFSVIPSKILGNIELELDFQKKQEHLVENYSEKIKNMFIGKLNNFSDVLKNISLVLGKLADNEKLEMKNKSDILVQNLADRVCSSCSMKSLCWVRESYYSYSSFGELIQNFEEKKMELPKELERKCIKRTELVKNTEEIVNNFIVNEMWQNRLSECRELLSGQINNMADSVGEIVGDFEVDVKINSSVENNLRKILDKNRIKYKDVFCYNSKNDRLVIELSKEQCSGKQECVKEILPLVNSVAKKYMCIANEECCINKKEGICSTVFEEAPKYYVASYVSRICRNGESYNGDSYCNRKLKDGSFLTIISDGMGSGPEAFQESSAVVELIERFVGNGFNKLTAISTINSIMSIKFDKDERFSTVDMSSIDTYSGDISFMKVGAIPSFIKRGEHVQVISSKTLPIGVLDKVDVDIIDRTLKNGDMIVMVSDGLIDYVEGSKADSEWIVDYLKKSNNIDPKDLSQDLILKAKELSGGKIKDDMTVIVLKIHNLYD